jgi:hypothetical protein
MAVKKGIRFLPCNGCYLLHLYAFILRLGVEGEIEGLVSLIEVLTDKVTILD